MVCIPLALFSPHYSSIKKNKTLVGGHVVYEEITGYDIGWDFIKGLWITLFLGTYFISFSKHGVNHIINNKYKNCSGFIWWAVIARFIAIIDSILTILFSPISMAFYILSIPLSIILAIILAFYGCCKDNDKYAILSKSYLKWSIACIPSIFAAIFIIIISPIFVVFPELILKAIKLDKWGNYLGYCYE